MAGNDFMLIVDDDAAQRSLLTSFLKGQGFSVKTACSGEEALALMENETPALLISDVRMPGISGMELLHHVSDIAPAMPVLLVTAYADVRDAVGAVRKGALDYLEKPIDLDELLSCVRGALGVQGGGPAVAGTTHALPEGVVAQSTSMKEVVREIALVAPSDTRVLITGESGTGKEVAADLIHAWSPRASFPFIKVNCAAIPETLLESELFGHERGAFTGATSQRIGRFEEADKGVILLDEIAEMSPALQAKLLRITQNGVFHRVGSNVERQSDVRILASTNRDLDDEVAKGMFREDLFYRLNVMEIHLSPLRERPADIPELAQHFAARFARGKARFSPGAMAALEAYAWPGNVRELRNAMERAVLLARGSVILPEHLPHKVRQLAAEDAPDVPGKRMEDVERAAILRTLREQNNNRTEAARALGISRRALTYKLRAYREQGYEIDPS